MWKELIRKIELQSILVLTITLFVGCLLFRQKNTFNTPSGIFGCIIVGFGALYTFVSFFTNNIKESYKDVIVEYKTTIKTMRDSYDYMSNSYQKTIDTTTKEMPLTGYISQSSEKTMEI